MMIYRPDNSALSIQHSALFLSWGRGIEKITDACKATGLPEPVFEENTGGFAVELLKAEVSEELGNQLGNSWETVGQTPVEKRGEKLSENRQNILNAMRADPTVSQAKLVEIVGIGPTNIEKNIKFLKDHGWIRRVGPAKGGHWEVIEP